MQIKIMHQIKNADLSSELDVEGDIAERKRKRYDLATKESKFGPKTVHGKKIHRSDFEEKIDKEERINRRGLLTIDAYSRHVNMVNNYLNFYGGTIKDLKYDHSKDKNLADVLRDEHKFIWDETDKTDTWSKRLTKKYYERLFREYCIVDLSLYTTGNVGMRWRTHKEVIQGKGQFICGEKNCTNTDDLASWEVNFAYVEKDEYANLQKKNALVKARLCPQCSVKLNFKYLPQIKALRAQLKKARKREKVKNVHTSDEDANEVLKSDSEKVINPSKPPEQIKTDDELGDVENFETPPTTSKEIENPKKDLKSDKIWSGSGVVPKESLEKSREEEFDEYFQNMFL